MRLKRGQAMPHFEVRDYSGKIFSTEKLDDKKLMLSFYRYAACPFCNLRINQLKNLYLDNWKNENMEMIGVFQSPSESIKKYAPAGEHYFPIIPDPERKLYKLYRVEKSWHGFFRAFLRLGELISMTAKGLLKIDPEGPPNRLPADFLINADGTIHTAYYAKDIGDHIPIDLVEEWLSENK